MALSRVQRVTSLFERVIAPIVLGGEVHPVEVLTPEHAGLLADQAIALGRVEGSDWVEIARTRRARQLCPIDAVPTIGRDEWLLAAALNNVFQAVDPRLNSVFSSSRIRRAINLAQDILALVPPVDTLHDALARHATFALVLKTERVDTTVRWWCGSAMFYGCTPPRRLLAWPNVRQVRTERSKKTLAELSAGESDTEMFMARTLRMFLGKTPLTDLFTMTRPSPSFEWNEYNLALLSTPVGRTLALRTLRMLSPTKTIPVLNQAQGWLMKKHPNPAFEPVLQAVLEEIASYP